MKRLSLSSLATLLFAVFATNLMAENAIDAKLKIIIPKVKFQDQSVTDVFSIITKMSREQDPNKKGVNIVVLGDAKNTKTKINLNGDDLPVAAIIKYVCDQAKLAYRVDKYAIVIGNKGAAKQLDTKFYLANAKLIGIVDEQFKGDFKVFLEAFGVKFPAGAKATIIRNMNRLVITNSKAEHDKLKKLIKQL